MKEFNIKFVGIDDWNRPVFKVEDKDVYFGDVNRFVLKVEFSS